MREPPERLQVLITGCYRSGTGYFSLLLGNHPELAVGHHTTNWPRERHLDVGEALYYASRRWGIEPVFHEAPLGLQTWDFTMQTLFGSPRWAEKVQLAWRFIPTFLNWFPDDGRAIIVLRDPRSVIASFREYTYHDPPAYLGAAFNCLNVLDHATSLYSNPRVFVARYEDYAKRPARIRGVLSWLGLDWPGTDVMLDPSGWSKVPGGPVATRSAFDKVKDLDVDKAIHRWKDHLNYDELLFVETVCAGAMQRWRYEPVTAANMDPGRMMDMCEGDKVAGWCRAWLKTGEGVQAFPSDPRDPSTWAENNPRPAA